MNEAKYTPGPWKVGFRALDVVAPGKLGDFKICDIRGWGYLTGKGSGALGLPDKDAVAIQEANARLIAAAPDLLGALKGLTAAFINPGDGSPFEDGEVSAIDAARAAIAKATASE